MRALQPDFEPLLTDFQSDRASLRVLILVSPT